MPRHFGLKATSVAERSGSTGVSDPIPAPAVPTAPSPSLSPDDTPEVEALLRAAVLTRELARLPRAAIDLGALNDIEVVRSL